MQNSSRRQVLALYGRIIRLSRSWRAQDPEHTAKEREYIREEARWRFKEHKSEADPDKVRELLEAAEKRLQLACHYGIPYDRPPYLPPATSYDVDPRAKTFKQRKQLRRDPTTSS